MRLSLLILFCLLLCGLTKPLSAQPYSLEGKSVGIYISSKDFQFSELMSMQITQFLTIGEDRSYAGRLKPEFMIRLGWLLTEQLGGISGADTVHFINADPPKAYAFKEAYDPVLNQYLGSKAEALKELDVVLVLSSLDLKFRTHRSSYVMSNRIITERINIRTGQIELTPFVLHDRKRLNPVQVCFDEQTDKSLVSHFDFYREQSPYGKFLSKIFSNCWEQWQNELRSNCPDD